MSIFYRTIGIFVLSLILGCSGPGGGVTGKMPERQNRPVSASVVAEVLDAVQSELVMEGLCKGGETLRLAFSGDHEEPRKLRLYYSVPRILTLSREAYVQRDGLVLLADDLSFRDFERRWSTKPIAEDEFAAAFQLCATRVTCTIDGELTPSQLGAYEERMRRKADALARP